MNEEIEKVDFDGLITTLGMIAVDYKDGGVRLSTGGRMWYQIWYLENGYVVEYDLMERWSSQGGTLERWEHRIDTRAPDGSLVGVVGLTEWNEDFVPGVRELYENEEVKE